MPIYYRCYVTQEFLGFFYNRPVVKVFSELGFGLRTWLRPASSGQQAGNPASILINPATIEVFV